LQVAEVIVFTGELPFLSPRIKALKEAEWCKKECAKISNTWQIFLEMILADNAEVANV